MASLNASDSVWHGRRRTLPLMPARSATFPSRRCGPHLGHSLRRRSVSARPKSGDVRVMETDIGQETQDADHLSTKAVEDSEQKYKGKTAVVVGGGPAGVMASAVLAKHGFKVKVYERRRDVQKNPYVNNKANLIRLFPGTIEAMQSAGIKLPEEGFKHGVHALLGIGLFGSDGIEIYHRDTQPGKRAYIGERLAIATLLLNDIRDEYPDNVDFVFEHTCQAVDFESKTVTFADENGVEIVERYDLLIAADGTNSFIRKKLQEVDKELTVYEYPSSRVYKTVRNLSVLNEEDEDVMKLMQPGWVGTFISNDNSHQFVQSPTTAGITLYSSSPGTINMLVNHTMDAFHKIEGREEEWLCEFLPKTFPTKWKQEAAERLPTVPLAHSIVVKKVSKLCSLETVLIGDAGHSSSPALGLGCNLAIIDGTYLDKALRIANGDEKTVAETFHSLRFQEVRETQNLLLIYQLVHVRRLGLVHLLRWLGKIHLWVHTAMKWIAPQLAPNAVNRRFNEGEITAIEAMKIIKRDGMIFFGIIFLVAVLTAVGLPPLARKLLPNILK